MKKLIKSLFIFGAIYAGYRGLKYEVKRATFESMRKDLINYANENNIDNCPFYKMNYQELRYSRLYIYDYLKYDISLKVNPDLYKQIKLISIKYHIFLQQ